MIPFLPMNDLVVVLYYLGVVVAVGRVSGGVRGFKGSKKRMFFHVSYPQTTSSVGLFDKF
jgi:hypothetical protein